MNAERGRGEECQYRGGRVCRRALLHRHRIPEFKYCHYKKEGYKPMGEKTPDRSYCFLSVRNLSRTFDCNKKRFGPGGCWCETNLSLAFHSRQRPKIYNSVGPRNTGGRQPNFAFRPLIGRRRKCLFLFCRLSVTAPMITIRLN